MSDPGLDLLRRMRTQVGNAFDLDDPEDVVRRLRAGTLPQHRTDARFETARGRRQVEFETISRQLAQYEQSYATATGDRKERLGRSIEQLKKELSPWGGGDSQQGAGRRFLGGVVAAAPQMALSLADLALAPVQIAEGVVGRDAQWGRGLRGWIAERQALIEEATGSRGVAGIAGNLAGGLGIGTAAHLARGVPVLGSVARLANIGGEGYSRIANATLRFVGRSNTLKPLAKAGLEGSRLQRAAGQIAADIPLNLAQIGSMDDMGPEDLLRAMGFSAVGAGVGGALGAKVPLEPPKFDPGLGGADGPGNQDPHAQAMSKQMKLIKAWQEANPDKPWSDLSPDDRKAVLDIQDETTTKSAEDLVQLATALRGFLLGDHNSVDGARRAYNTLRANGANPDVILGVLGMRLEGEVPVAPDGRVPTAERLMLASGESPREAVTAARVESDAKTHQSQRLNDLLNRTREDLRIERQERRAAQRLAMSDVLIPEMQGQRAWEQAMPSIEADEGTYVAKFDINNFKALNDAIGQSGGDEAIKTIGRIVASTAEAAGLRSFRIGGDEFVVAGPLGTVSQVRHEIETLLYGSKFRDIVLSMSGGIGQTLREAELDLKPRKIEAKRSLGQPLSRSDGDYIGTDVRESLPTVQVFKAVRENGLNDIVRAANKGTDHIAAEAAAREVLGQFMEMTAQGIDKERVLRVLRGTYGAGEPTATMPRDGVSRGSTDVSRPDPVRDPSPKAPARPGANGANRNTTHGVNRNAAAEAKAHEAEEMWLHLQRTFPAPTTAQQKRIDFAEAQMRKLRKAADLTEMPLRRVPLAHPVAQALDDVPTKKARWNEIEDKLEDLDPGTDEYTRLQAEANELWAEIEALDGFAPDTRSQTQPPTAEPDAAPNLNREAPPSPSSTSPDPLQLETTRLPVPLEEMGPNEIEGIIDDLLRPYDRDESLLKTPQFAATQRDIAKLREAYKKVNVTGEPTSKFALEQNPDEARLAELTARPLTELKEAELTELNVLLQNVNNRLPPDAPRKAAIVDQILELRHYQHDRELNKNRGRTNKKKTEAEEADELLDKAALRYARKQAKKKGTEGFTIPEAQAAIVASGVGGLVGYAAPTDDDNERLRNAMLGAMLAGGGTAGTFYIRGKIKGAQQLKRGPKYPGEAVLDETMHTTLNDEALANFTPARFIQGIWEGMDKLYARTLHPSLGGERIARVLALGDKIGKQVGDILATFGIHKRVANDWIYRGPIELNQQGQWQPVMVQRADGTVAQVQPVASILASVDNDIEMLGKTALALSAAEQWVKYGRLPHPKLNPIDVERFIRNVDPKYLGAAQQMRDVHLGLLDMQVKAGLLTPAMRQKMGAEEFYTAMERLFGDGIDQGLGTNIGTKIKGLFAQRAVKARKGPNDYDIRNPVETLWIAIARTAKAVEMNEKKAALIALWEASNVPDEVKRSFMRPMVKPQQTANPTAYQQRIQAMKQMLPNLTTAEIQLMIDAFDPQPLGPKSDFMTYIRDGKSEVWRLSPELVQTFGYMQGWEIGDIWRVLGVGSNLARKGVALSPDFVGRVAFFDVFQSYMNSQWGVRPGLEWLAAFKDIWTKSDSYKSWGGGQAESTLLEDLIDPQDILRRSRGTQGKTVGADIRRSLVQGNLVDAYRKLLIPFAEAGRFSEYAAARRHGANVQEAIRASAAVGGYFNQVGLYAAGLFHAVPFAKGISQSIDQTIYSAGAHPFRPYDGNRLSKAIKWWGKGATAIGLPTLLFYLANKDDEEIQQLRQTENGRRQWYFRLPNGGILDVRKPAGPEGQLFGTGLEIFLDAWRGKEPEAFEQFAQSMMNELQIPWIPPAVQAGVTLATGKDLSFGSSLISERLQGLPTSMQASSATTGIAQTLSEGLTGLTGEPTGFWERALSPIGLEYIARTLGGTLGKEALQLADMGQQWVEHGSMPVAREWPILRRFMTVDMTRAQTRDMEDFYSEAARAEKIVGGLNQSLREGDVQGFVDITTKYPPQELAAMKTILSVRGSIAQLQRAIEEMRSAEGGDVQARNAVIIQLRRSVLQQIGSALNVTRGMQN